MLYSSGVIKIVIDNIPEDEYLEIVWGVKDSIDAIYKYQNSVLGILDTISTDYSALDLDASEIQKKIADPQNLELLKNVLTKLG